LPYEITGKIVLMAVCTILVAVSLLSIGKKKKEFRIYPDSIKKDFYKVVRIGTIANAVSALLIIATCAVIEKNYAYLILLVSLFISVGALYSVYEQIGDIHDEK
jgi:hypothetical protein